MTAVSKLTGFLVMFLCLFLCSASALALTISEIQYTEAADGSLDYTERYPEEGSIVDCDGGIVIGTFITPWNQRRLQVYDPANPNGWGAIQVKDFSSTNDLFNGVSVGDWVSFASIPVEDNVGTTFLLYGDSSSYSVLSSGNTLPTPLAVSAPESLINHSEPL